MLGLQRFLKSISYILNSKIASFALTHLGVLISPKKLTTTSFKPIVDRIYRTALDGNTPNYPWQPSQSLLIILSLLSLLITSQFILFLILSLKKSIRLLGISFDTRVAMEKASTRLLEVILLILRLRGPSSQKSFYC